MKSCQVDQQCGKVRGWNERQIMRMREGESERKRRKQRAKERERAKGKDENRGQKRG